MDVKAYTSTACESVNDTVLPWWWALYKAGIYPVQREYDHVLATREELIGVCVYNALQ